jgi:hypothetical protein
MTRKSRGAFVIFWRKETRLKAEEETAMTITELKQSIALLEKHLSKGCCRRTLRKAIHELKAELAIRYKEARNSSS